MEFQYILRENGVPIATFSEYSEAQLFAAVLKVRFHIMSYDIVDTRYNTITEAG